MAEVGSSNLPGPTRIIKKASHLRETAEGWLFCLANFGNKLAK